MVLTPSSSKLFGPSNCHITCYVSTSNVRSSVIVDLEFEGGLKMLSIRVDSIESTRVIRIDWSLWPRFKNDEGSYFVISRILTSGGLYRVVENVVDSSRFDGIDTNRFPCCRFDMPEVDLHETYSAPGQFRVGWKCSGFDRIGTNRLKFVATF